MSAGQHGALAGAVQHGAVVSAVQHGVLAGAGQQSALAGAGQQSALAGAGQHGALAGSGQHGALAGSGQHGALAGAVQHGAVVTRSLLVAGAAIALALGGCSKGGAGNNVAASAQPKAAVKAAGGETIAKGLGGDQRFVAAVKAAGMEPVFAGPGPYTVLVPTDAAFAKLAPTVRDALMTPGGKAKLVRLISHHVVPGTMLTADIAKAIDAHGGKARLATMAGGTLTATRSGAQIVLSEAGGATAAIVGSDDKRSNGVIDHIDTVLVPK